MDMKYLRERERERERELFESQIRSLYEFVTRNIKLKSIIENLDENLISEQEIHKNKI